MHSSVQWCFFFHLSFFPEVQFLHLPTEVYFLTNSSRSFSLGRFSLFHPTESALFFQWFYVKFILYPFFMLVAFFLFFKTYSGELKLKLWGFHSLVSQWPGTVHKSKMQPLINSNWSMNASSDSSLTCLKTGLQWFHFQKHDYFHLE